MVAWSKTLQAGFKNSRQVLCIPLFIRLDSIEYRNVKVPDVGLDSLEDQDVERTNVGFH